MIITLGLESKFTGEVRYFVTLVSVNHYYRRQVTKKSWLAIRDHLWCGLLFRYFHFSFYEYNDGKLVFIEEFKEG